MSQVFALTAIGDAVKSAVQAGDGEAVSRLMTQWRAKIHSIRQSGELPDMELRGLIGECIRLNEQWLELAVQAQAWRSRELRRLADVRRKHGIIHRTYAAQFAPAGHIYRNG